MSLILVLLCAFLLLVSIIKLITLFVASNLTYLPDLIPLEQVSYNNHPQFDASSVGAPYFAGSDTSVGSPGRRKGGLASGQGSGHSFHTEKHI